MNAFRPAVVPSTGRRRGRGGFTLLEVLVSLGVIIGALAGIAALLPAAGARLADANDIDRSGTMSANASADLVSRGLVRAALWSGVAKPAIVFGEGLGPLATTAPASTSVGAANATELAARVDPTVGYQLRDALQTSVTGSSVLTTGTWDPGISYGCMLSSTTGAAPTGPGATVRVTTVVFRKPGPEMKAFSLAPRGAGVFDIGSGGDVANDRRRFLGGCAWVLIVGSGEPRWFQIASSWTATAPGQTTGAPTGTSSLALSGSGFSSGTLQAFGFENLLRVNERFMSLE